MHRATSALCTAVQAVVMVSLLNLSKSLNSFNGFTGYLLCICGKGGLLVGYKVFLATLHLPCIVLFLHLSCIQIVVCLLLSYLYY